MENGRGPKSADSSRKTLRFTLVHGTFVPDAEWVRSDSEDGFRQRLRRALEGASLAEYDIAFDEDYEGWTGHNTWAARIEGGKTLRDHLHVVAAEDGVDQFVVAHSHAGNVALYALRDTPQPPIRGLVCLATPFLVSSPRELKPLLLTLSLGFLVFVAVLGSMNPWLRGLMAAFVVLYGITAVELILTRQRFRQQILDLGEDPAAEDGHRPEADASQPEQRGEFRELFEERSLGQPAAPLLVVRTPGDEAEGVLRVSQLSTSTLSRIWGALDWTLGVLIAVSAVGFALRSDASASVLERLGWTAEFEAADRWLNSWLDPVMGTLLTVAAAAVVLMVLMRLAFGFDARRWVAIVETAVERVPPGVAAEPVVLDKQPWEAGRRRHSVYDHPDTPVKIASWVRGVLEEPPARTIRQKL